MKRSLTQQTVAGMAWMIYVKVAFAILQLVILGILARLLVPADFGVIAASSLMSRELRFRWLANLDVVTYAIGYGIIGVTVALLHWGVWALVAAQMAQTLLKTIILLSQHPPRFRDFTDRAAFGDLMYFGGGFTMARIANYVALNGDDMTVGRFLGRQLAYAGLVLLGAWIGQHWGIAGVAWGTLAALTVNFILMAELGLDVGHVTWSEFWEAHRPAVLLTAATFPPVYAATTVLRHFESPPVMTVIAVAVLALAVGCSLILTAPAIFLGADGQWMLETLRTFIRRLRPAVEPAAAVTVE
jgi:hypothetical protein